jgi:hypothetical protein
MQLTYGSNGVAGGFDFELLRGMAMASMAGAGVGETFAAAARIKRNDMESWTREFARLADRVLAEAERSLVLGDHVSAREQLRRVSTYYRLATFYVAPDDERHHQYWAACRQAYHRSLQLSRLRTEVLEIPFEGNRLPAYFTSGGDGVRPTLLVLGGFDSTAEELMMWIGEPAAERGWNTLVFEGPGQPGALHLNPGLIFRPDYEVPVGAVLDYALSRPDVDPDRLALLGYSLGGMLAPRAAAKDSRIKAVIPNTLGVDIGAALRMAIPPAFWKLPAGVIDGGYDLLTKFNDRARWFYQHAQWAMGVKTPTEFLHMFDPYNLDDVRGTLACPMLVFQSEDEIAEAPPEMAVETAQFMLDIPALVSTYSFTREEAGSAHCQLDSPERLPPVLMHWLNRVFAHDWGNADDVGYRQAMIAKTAGLARKHHGDRLADMMLALAYER